MVSFDYGENTADSGIVWKTTKGRCRENSMKILARGMKEMHGERNMRANLQVYFYITRHRPSP